MTKKNQYGDNGWWKKTGDTLAHYFTEKLPLCGTAKFNSPDIGVQVKNCYDKRCKNCSKVRRNQLRARMNISASIMIGGKRTKFLIPFDDPKKSQ